MQSTMYRAVGLDCQFALRPSQRILFVSESIRQVCRGTPSCSAVVTHTVHTLAVQHYCMYMSIALRPHSCPNRSCACAISWPRNNGLGLGLQLSGCRHRVPNQAVRWTMMQECSRVGTSERISGAKGGDMCGARASTQTECAFLVHKNSGSQISCTYNCWNKKYKKGWMADRKYGEWLG
jgi:hypothetical protein